MIKLFIIEDHPVTIAGLRTYFRPSRDEIIITLTANDMKEALSLDPDADFDLILLDLWLPDGDPTDNFHRIEKHFPGKPVIIYTAETSLHWQRKMYKLGARAFINKNADKSTMEKTLMRVSDGETVYSAAMKEYQTKRKVEKYRDPKYGLTREQEKMLHLFIEGMTSKDIARTMDKSISSVNKMLKDLRRIFGVSNNVDLVITVLEKQSHADLDSSEASN
ncbi:MAG TPA: response regulator transcription factor, partial [Bacteroidales bacterium]|nr:response regulator transcription factor [Bacteroidales bacterium]